MTYYMTAKNSSTISCWEKCTAKTLTGAKREATKRFSGGYITDVICVGIDEYDCDNSPKKIISENRYGKWADRN